MMGTEILRPADIVRRVRELAEKRDKQAATTSNPKVREQLIATAKNYRALAAELGRKTHSFD
jgi:hypothetical protein